LEENSEDLASSSATAGGKADVESARVEAEITEVFESSSATPVSKESNEDAEIRLFLKVIGYPALFDFHFCVNFRRIRGLQVLSCFFWTLITWWIWAYLQQLLSASNKVGNVKFSLLKKSNKN
jgi:hypothetical protein